MSRIVLQAAESTDKKGSAVVWSRACSDRQGVQVQAASSWVERVQSLNSDTNKYVSIQSIIHARTKKRHIAITNLLTFDWFMMVDWWIDWLIDWLIQLVVISIIRHREDRQLGLLNKPTFEAPLKTTASPWGWEIVHISPDNRQN